MQDDDLRSSLGYALVRAFRRVNRASSQAVQGFGLSGEQAHILLVLWREGPQTVGQLQRLLSLSSGTLTGALDRMEKAKLLHRRSHPKDGRTFVVEAAHFTPQRRRAIEAALRQLEEDAFSALGVAERRTLLRLLTKLA